MREVFRGMLRVIVCMLLFSVLVEYDEIVSAGKR